MDELTHDNDNYEFVYNHELVNKRRVEKIKRSLLERFHELSRKAKNLILTTEHSINRKFLEKFRRCFYNFQVSINSERTGINNDPKISNLNKINKLLEGFNGELEKFKNLPNAYDGCSHIRLVPRINP